MRSKAKAPLKIEITPDNRLQISIGIDTLVFAAARCDYVYSQTNDDGNPRPGVFEKAVTSQIAFAVDVKNALAAEAEDGTTLIHMMLDAAFENVISSGDASVGPLPNDGVGN